MKKRSPFSILIYLAVLALVFSLIFGLFGDGTDNIPYSTVLELLEEGQVKNFVVEGDKIALELHNPYEGKDELICALADVSAFRTEVQPLLEKLTNAGTLDVSLKKHLT